MIHKLTYIISEDTSPYNNLALEEYLLQCVEAGECILYLWQNRNTVVIGKNQNAWKECNIEQLNRDGANLVRRLSGGGAVYHDMGNLNFTFLVHRQDYNVEKQLEVILRAVRTPGLQAEKTGRNDITIDGKKFSGNAFYESNGHCYHHGTVMVRVDINTLAKFLNVSEDKLKSKGVGSVKARVANLTDYDPGITIESLKTALIEAFGEIYGLVPLCCPAERIDHKEIIRLENKLKSRDWIYGRKIEFNYEMAKRFIWGDLNIQLKVNSGIITDAAVYSDALVQSLISKLQGMLVGLDYNKAAVCESISLMQHQAETEDTNNMLSDICRFFEEQNF